MLLRPNSRSSCNSRHFSVLVAMLTASRRMEPVSILFFGSCACSCVASKNQSLDYKSHYLNTSNLNITLTKSDYWSLNNPFHWKYCWANYCSHRGQYAGSWVFFRLMIRIMTVLTRGSHCRRSYTRWCCWDCFRTLESGGRTVLGAGNKVIIVQLPAKVLW